MSRFGDHQGLMKYLGGGLERQVRRKWRDVQLGLYNFAAEEARKEILNGSIRPASQKGGTTLIEDMDYVMAIGVFPDGDGFMVGLPPWEIHPGSGLPYEALWGILRYGTSDGRIPARPHIDTVIERSIARLPKFLRDHGFS